MRELAPQQGGTRGTTQRQVDKEVRKCRAALGKQGVYLRHRIHAVEQQILIVGQDQNDIGRMGTLLQPQVCHETAIAHASAENERNGQNS